MKTPHEQIYELWLGACGLCLVLFGKPFTPENLAWASEYIILSAWILEGGFMAKKKISTAGKLRYDLTVDCVQFECLIGTSLVAIRSKSPGRSWVMTRRTDEAYAEIEAFIKLKLDEELHGETKAEI